MSTYFVYDTDRMRSVAGPFDSRAYAETVLERAIENDNWTNPDGLRVLTERTIAQYICESGVEDTR